MKKFFLYTLGLIQLLRLLTRNPIFLNQREQLIIKTLLSPVRMMRKQGFSMTIWAIDCCNFEGFEIMKAVFLHVIHSF